MRFKIDGEELSADGMTVNELCDAEKALKRNMTEGTGAAIAIQMFVAMKRKNPGLMDGVIADQVGRADVTTLADVDEEGDAGPPAGTPAGNGAGTEAPAALLSSGHQPSVPSA